MNRRTVALAAVGVLLLSATVAVQAEETEKGSCQIEGTWYGFNTVGETYLFTINKAKGKGYTAVGQSPATPAPFFSFVTGELAGTHAYLTKVGRNSFDSTWMTMSWVDPGYDFDFDPFD